MKRLITVLAFFCAIATTVHAQVIGETETLRRIYEQTTIMPVGKGFMKNGVVVKNKLFENALKTELEQTPEAFERFKKARWQTAGYITGLTFGVILTDASAFSFQYAQDREERAGLLTTFVGGQILTMGSSNMLHKALNNTQNAIWLHNRAQILNETRKNPSLDATKVAELYDRNTIQFASSGFYQNGRYQTFGFLNKNLDKLMHNNPLAMTQLKKAKVNKLISIGLSVAGIAALMVSTTKNTGKASIFDNKWFWGGYGISIAGSLVAVQSNNQISRAAWFYNRDAFAGN
jgi:hypothetical protein